MKETKVEQSSDSKRIGEIIEDLFQIKKIKEILMMMWGLIILLFGLIILLITIFNNMNIPLIISSIIDVIAGLTIMILSHYAGVYDRWKAYMLYTNAYNIFNYESSTKNKKKK